MSGIVLRGTMKEVQSQLRTLLNVYGPKATLKEVYEGETKRLNDRKGTN